MATWAKRGKKYIVRWRDPDGAQRTRTVPDLETAKALTREVERSAGLGRRWEPEDADPVPALIEVRDGAAVGGLFHDFLGVARGRYAAETVRHYDHALRRFLVYLQGLHPNRRRLTVDLLSRDVVEGWFGSLTSGDGALAIATARLRVGAVFAAWEWGEDSDKYGAHVPRMRRFVMPAPTFAPAAAPTWQQMDQAIAAALCFSRAGRTGKDRAGWLWRYRLLIVLRFTGLRANEQAMQLRWDDVDLERRELLIRGELGKSRRERSGRILPLAPALVELVSGWGVREGWLVGPDFECRYSHSNKISDCWRAAGVPERIWGAGARGHGSAHHAFRRGFKTGLSRLGVGADVRDYLLGHHRGVDEHYLDSFDQARDAVAKLPPLTCDQGVINLDARRKKKAATSG